MICTSQFCKTTLFDFLRSLILNNHSAPMETHSEWSPVGPQSFSAFLQRSFPDLLSGHFWLSLIKWSNFQHKAADFLVLDLAQIQHFALELSFQDFPLHPTIDYRVVTLDQTLELFSLQGIRKHIGKQSLSPKMPNLSITLRKYCMKIRSESKVCQIKI